MTITTDTPADGLHARMIEAITADAEHLPRTIETMRAVPRLAFLRAIDPAVTAEDAYDPELAVTTLKDPATGAVLSCSSVPTLVATMLDQADVQPGNRVLEIGSATGINAAYLAHLTGPEGQVFTLDIDQWVTDGTRRALDVNGYEHVQVIARDGSLGYAEAAPFDRIVVTVGAFELSAAWWDQLAPRGRMVVPLRWRGQTRSLALVREGDRLVSESVKLCGFVPMIGQDGERTAAIDAAGTAFLHWDEDQAIDPGTLAGVLDQAKAEAWTDVTIVSGESFDGIWLRLTAIEPGTCRIEAKPDAVASGLCKPAIPVRSPAIVEGDSLAYFVLRVQTDTPQRRWELGAVGHGPAGPQLADRLCAQIRAWSTDRDAEPKVTAHRGGTLASDQPDRAVITKRDCSLRIEYPAA
jgi:protein-L-isoaspartate(D-aspartate) O-methyltransferase